ncbi:hypothetical protein [Arthrobacter glacialis]|uniref:hypothetical protein n=1 Tax=Arthrobacter glacialis TaxID=1664 RepID=UPI0013FD8A94|nr:hypothetical protein [Arthrobacter glacialis]
MRQEVLVVADQRAETIGFVDPASQTVTGWIPGMVLAEHAGILPLGSGRCAWVDDAGGSLIIMDPFVDMDTDPEASIEHRISVAIPAEHLACDVAGRFVAVSTGLGKSWEPWSDLLSVVDLEAQGGPRSRRMRTRTGEPGVVVATTPNGPRVVLRHREPGGLESVSVKAILADGVHCPQLRGESIEATGAAGHGDAYDPVAGTLFVATERGLECFDVRGHTPAPLPTRPWGAAGRAYFLRFCPRRRLLVAVLREGGERPRQWVTWGNTLWIHDIDANTSRTKQLGDGMIFRFALTLTAIAVARIHPGGDDLRTYDAQTLQERGRWALPSMDRAPRPGVEPWDDADRRAVAGSPGGEWVAVTRGGHGEVHLIDTNSPESAIHTVKVPTPLHDGGHLGWLNRADTGPGDAVGR